MSTPFHHEALYRGPENLARLAQTSIVICGAGAIGSNLAHTLARQGFAQLTVIDDDRIESHNISTQLYGESDVGAFKVEILQAELFRAVGIEITALRQRLTARNVTKLLAGANVVVDGFDNHTARALVTAHCHQTGVPCLHIGLHTDYAEIHWNEGYRVPQDPPPLPPGMAPCDYPLARNLIQIAVSLASETLIRFLLEDQRPNYTFTLRDLRINQEQEQ